jgi:ATP-dependent protease ClpP protease subunit
MYQKLLFLSSLWLGTIFLQDSVVYSQQREQKQQVSSQQTNQKQIEESTENVSISPPIIELKAPINDSSVSELLFQLHIVRRIYADNPQRFKKVILLINSGGGEMNAVKTAYEHLKNLPFTLHTHNMAEASSSAAAIYCAGDIRTASPNAVFILHYPTFSGGINVYSENQSLTIHEEMKSHSRFFEKVTSDCTNLSKEQVKNTLQKETVYNLNEALEVDLVQETSYPSEAINNPCHYSVIYSQNNRVASKMNSCFAPN